MKATSRRGFFGWVAAACAAPAVTKLEGLSIDRIIVDDPEPEHEWTGLARQGAPYRVERITLHDHHGRPIQAYRLTGKHKGKGVTAEIDAALVDMGWGGRTAVFESEWRAACQSAVAS